MDVDPTTDTTDSVRTSSWMCSYTLRLWVYQPVADRIVRTSFRAVPTRMVAGLSFGWRQPGEGAHA